MPTSGRALGAALALACLLSGLAPAQAQEPSKDPAARDPLAARLPDPLPKERLSETRWFGVYDRLGRSVGTLSLAVAANDQGYTARLLARYRFRGGEPVEVWEQLRLGPDLSLRELRQTAREGGEKAPRAGFKLTRGEAGCEGHDEQGKWPVELSHPPLAGVAHTLLVAELVTPAKGRLELTRLGPRDEPAQARWLEATTRKDPKDGVEVVIGREVGQELRGWRLLRDAQGRLTRGEPAGWEGITLQAAKDEADAKRDRPVVPPGTARAAVLEFLLAIAAGEAEAAAKLVDWPTFQRNAGEAGPKQDPAAFRKQVLNRILRASGELEVESVERLASQLSERERAEGGRVVKVPGEGMGFVLEDRPPHGWRIVDLD